MSSKAGEVAPPKAWDMMQDDPGAVLIDVRTTMEYQYVGRPVGAVHIPLMEPPSWEPDPSFVDKVGAALLGMGNKPGQVHELPLLLICRSGTRSGRAAAQLAEAGFNHVYNVLEGFEGGLDDRQHRSTISGWRFHNLPWVQG